VSSLSSLSSLSRDRHSITVTDSMPEFAAFRLPWARRELFPMTHSSEK